MQTVGPASAPTLLALPCCCFPGSWRSKFHTWGDKSEQRRKEEVEGDEPFRLAEEWRTQIKHCWGFRLEDRGTHLRRRQGSFHPGYLSPFGKSFLTNPSQDSSGAPVTRSWRNADHASWFSLPIFGSPARPQLYFSHCSIPQSLHE